MEHSKAQTHVPLTPEEHKKQLAELDELVERRKTLVSSGKVTPEKSREERRAEFEARKGVASLGDLLKIALPAMEENAKRAQEEILATKEKIHALEPRFCEDHENEELPVDVDRTCGLTWKNKTFTVAYLPCVECKKVRKNLDSLSRKLDMGIPNKLVHATFQNYDVNGDVGKKRALMKFKDQYKRGRGFIMAVGEVGTGKSHLGAATINEAGDGVFVTQHDLIGELRQTYSSNSSQDELVSKYRNAKVLVLDEITPEVKGVDISPFLYRVLGYRYDNDLLTVITSNEPIEVCMSILGPRLRDRIRDEYVIANFIWESHRGQKPS